MRPINRPRNFILLAAAALVVAALVFVGFNTSGGSAGGETTVTATSTIPPAGVDTPDCEDGDDTGSGEWELKDLHGDDNSVLNGGAEDWDEVLDAARHDPLILREVYIGLKAPVKAKNEGISETQAIVQLNEEVPTVEQLRCVDLRKQWHAKLAELIDTGVTEKTPMGSLADDLGAQPDGNGNYHAPNTSVDGDDVGVGRGTIPPDEDILVTKFPNGAKAYHRTFCANKLFPHAPIPAPGKGALEVIKTDDGANLFRTDLPVPGIRIILDGPEHREGVTDGSGLVRFNDLTPGTYTVSEIVPSGWEPVTPASVTVEIKADTISFARFKNRQVEEEVPSATPRASATPRPSATNTPRVPTSTPVPPTATPRPPTATPVPPTQTPEVVTPVTCPKCPTRTPEPTPPPVQATPTVGHTIPNPPPPTSTPPQGNPTQAPAPDDPPVF